MAEGSTSRLATAPSVFTSLHPSPDNTPKAHLVSLESRLSLGSPTALLNDHLRAEALAAKQRTADWAQQRRKAGKETALSDVQRGKRRRIEEGWKESTEEVVEVPQVERPQGFPSNDLLSSLHSHAAHHFASHHLLLPPLTPSSPLLPPSSLAHLEALKAILDAQDEEAARRYGEYGGVKRWNDTKSNWYRVKDRGDRKRAWRDVERKLEPSALVALGILAELLTSDTLHDPSLHPPNTTNPSDPSLPTPEEEKLLKQRALRSAQNRRAGEKRRAKQAEEKALKARREQERVEKIRRAKARRREAGD
ncbi:hypothetical protein RQP46_002034 [Phenoliferia psychrophenolica]